MSEKNCQVSIFKGFWGIKDTKKYCKYLFIYGDNDIRQGKGGQAIIRDCKNAAGIPTKKLPSLDQKSFYTDKEYDENKEKIKNAIKLIIKKVKKCNYKGIILPKDGLGTGLAELPKRAPKTFKYLLKKIEKLKVKISKLSYNAVEKK